MNKYLETEAKFPIFDAVQFKDKVIISGGGGGAQFGISNQICVKSANSFEDVFSFDSGADIFERLLANEVDDFIVAVSDANFKLFEVTPKGHLRLADTFQLSKDAGAGVVSQLVGKRLLIQDNSNILFLFNVKDHRLVPEFESPLTERILAFVGHPEHRHALFVFPDKVNVFDFAAKSFIETACQLKDKLKKVFACSTDDFSRLLLIFTEQSKTAALIFKAVKSRPYGFELESNQFLNSGSVSAVAFKESTLCIATAEGEVLVYDLSPLGRLRKRTSKLLHMLPVRSLLLRKMPTTSPVADCLSLTSFGIDYKIASHSLSTAKDGEFVALLSLMKVIAILILLAAIVLKLIR